MKVAILMPSEPDHGWIWRLQIIVRELLGAEGRKHLPDLKVVIGIARNEVERVSAALNLPLGCSCSVRAFEWITVEPQSAARMYSDLEFDYSGITVIRIPRDWGWNFADCNVWLLPADSNSDALLFLRPTLLLARDCAERYRHVLTYSDLERRLNRLLTWRQCAGAIGSSVAIFDDLCGFVGLRRTKAILTPQMRLPAPVARGGTATSKGGVFCFGRFDDPEILRIALNGVARARQDVSCEATFGYDAICLTPERARSSLDDIRRSVDRDCDGIRFALVESAQDLERFAQGCAIILAGRPFPSEPDDWLLAASLNKAFVGLRTPQLVALGIEDEPGTHLLKRWEEAAVAAAISAAVKAPAGEQSRRKCVELDPLGRGLGSLAAALAQLGSLDADEH